MIMNRIKIIGISIMILTTFVPESALADWKIYYTGVIGQQSGYHGRGSFATQSQCEQNRMTMPGGSMSYCGGFDTPTPSSPSGDDGTAAREQKKRAAIQRWHDFQNEEAMKRQMEDEARIKQGEKVLSKMRTVGSGGKLEPFSFGNPKLDLKPLSSQTYPAPSNAWEQALCAAYFSNLAKQSTKDVDARFYADQAQRVMVGEPTYLECRIPQVSNEKLAKRMAEVKKIYGDMNVKMKDLQDVEYKISESKEKIKNAELKKEEATTKLNELQNRAATAKPEEKAEVDDLTAMAQKQLQDAEQELNQAKQSEKDALNKKEQLEKELKNMNAKIQAGGE